MSKIRTPEKKKVLFYDSMDREWKNPHFFYAILMVEALPGLNFFLAVEKVLSGSLAL